MKIIILPFLFLLLAADEKPVTKVPVSKETTYVTGPLDKDGYIDYEAALNERLSKGITPEKNANVLIWKVLGPTPYREKVMPAEFFKRLGMDEPAKGGKYFIGLDEFMKGTVKLELYKRGAIDRWPWAANDFPRVAEWLNANEAALALTIEATKRPDFFNPFVTRRQGGKSIDFTRIQFGITRRNFTAKPVCKGCAYSCEL